MDDLLQENGDHLLQEDSFFILLETQGNEPSPYLAYPGTYATLPKSATGYRV